MKRQSLAAILAIGIMMAAGTASAVDSNRFGTRHGPIVKHQRGRAVPELSAGTVGGAAAVVVGGLMVLAGYRKKRSSTL